MILSGPGSSLQRTDLNKSKLNGANFKEADLSNTELSHVEAKRSDFNKAKLNNVNAAKIDLTEAELNEASLKKAKLTDANLSRAEFNNANLSEASLYKAKALAAEFNGANLFKANLNDTDLSEAEFKDANMQNSSLNNSIVENSDFSGANLSKSQLYNLQSKKPVTFKRAGLFNTEIAVSETSKESVFDMRGANLAGATINLGPNNQRIHLAKLDGASLINTNFVHRPLKVSLNGAYLRANKASKDALRSLISIAKANKSLRATRIVVKDLNDPVASSTVNLPNGFSFSETGAIPVLETDWSELNLMGTDFSAADNDELIYPLNNAIVKDSLLRNAIFKGINLAEALDLSKMSFAPDSWQGADMRGAINVPEQFLELGIIHDESTKWRRQGGSDRDRRLREREGHSGTFR